MVKEYKEKKITINLTKVCAKPMTKRTRAGIFLLKAKVRKETRAEEIMLSNQVNEAIWARGMYKCPRKITVKVVNDNGNARVYLPDEKVELKKEEKKKDKGLKARAEEMAGKKEKVDETQEDKKEATKVKKEIKEETKEEIKTEQKKEPAQEKTQEAKETTTEKK